MPGFKQHITVSSLLGGTYAGALHLIGEPWGEAIVAGGLCAASGMLPDLDSDSGTPVKELFSVWASINAVVVSNHLSPERFDAVSRILIAVCVYIFVRFILSELFNRLTVHRGMWHSIPALLIASGVTYLMLNSAFLAIGVCIGFLSHLVLDEIWSVKIGFGGVKLKASAGSALKLFSKNQAANAFCWTILIVCAYFVAVKMHLISDRFLLFSNTEKYISARLNR